MCAFALSWKFWSGKPRSSDRLQVPPDIYSKAGNKSHQLYVLLLKESKLAAVRADGSTRQGGSECIGKFGRLG